MSKRQQLFTEMCKIVIDSIPEYNTSEKKEKKLKEIIEYRNQLILQMSSKAVDGIINRISPETLSSSIYQTAVKLTYSILLEEIPGNNKISSCIEKFEED